MVEGAWRDDARIEIRFDGSRREVEPYAAIVRSGRRYLLARDIKKRNTGWRRFAMDRIELPVVRRGVFVPKAVPAAFLGDDSLGWFTSGAERRVDVTVSSALARTAASRKWKDAQKVCEHDNGTVTLSFVVSETEEVVRWALGFGDEVWVSGPAGAVATARAMLARIAVRYAAVPSI